MVARWSLAVSRSLSRVNLSCSCVCLICFFSSTSLESIFPYSSIMMLNTTCRNISDNLNNIPHITTVIIPCLHKVHEINFFHFKQLPNTLWHLEIYFKFFIIRVYLYENIFCWRNFMPLFSTSNMYHSWIVTFLPNTHLAVIHEGHNYDSALNAPCNQFCTSSSIQQWILLSDIQKDPTDAS